MELMKISSLSQKNPCNIRITEDAFQIWGNYYYLVNKEFYKKNNAQDSCPIREYMGLGELNKRSPKKLFQFVGIAVVLEIVNTVVGKISDVLFFMNTDWLSYIVNAVAIICLVQGLRLFFSKKKVYEISFLSKRFCVDQKNFAEADMVKLNGLLMKLR